jgi:large subunit ribosomal protein L22
MKGYSMNEIPENCAKARLEGVNASYKELAEVCGRIRNKKSDWAISFLEQVAEGELPVMFKRHNKNMGHRHEVGGRKGRYPQKAAQFVLKTLQSAIANGKNMGLGEVYTILAASANKKDIYPRLAPKGRQARSFLETARIEIILKGSDVPKGVTVTAPKKQASKETPRPAETSSDAKTSETKKAPAPKKEPVHQHKHDVEKKEKKVDVIPHQHGEKTKG